MCCPPSGRMMETVVMEMEGEGWVDGEQVWDVESTGLASGFKGKRGKDQGNCEHLG